MTRSIPRILYAAAALIFAFGSFAHTLSYFRKAMATISASNLPPFYEQALKSLWLCDSTTLAALAAVSIYLAAKPSAASRTLVLLIALVPAGTTFMLYTFLGAFFAGHLLLAATVLLVLASSLNAQSDRVLAAA